MPSPGASLLPDGHSALEILSSVARNGASSPNSAKTTACTLASYVGCESAGSPVSSDSASRCAFTSVTH